MLKMIMLILLIVVLLGALPGVPWMSSYSLGYYPSGIALVVVILIILFL